MPYDAKVNQESKVLEDTPKVHNGYYVSEEDNELSPNPNKKPLKKVDGGRSVDEIVNQEARRSGEKETTSLIEQLVEILKGENYLNVDLSEDGKSIAFRVDNDIVDSATLKELNATVSVSDTTLTITAEKVVGDLAHNHGEVFLEIEGDGSHFGVALGLFPANAESVCFSAGRIPLDDNDFHDVEISVSETGLITAHIFDYAGSTTFTAKLSYSVKWKNQ